MTILERGLVVALARLEPVLFASSSLETVLAQLEAGTAEEPALLTAMCDEILAHRAPDGSWSGSMLLTADNLLLLRHLSAGDQIAVRPSLDWLASRQAVSGNFVDACTPALHLLQLCHHTMTGFYAPAPRGADLSQLQIPGARFRSDEDARIALSAHALCATWAWGVHTHSNQMHYLGLRRLVKLAVAHRFPLSIAALVFIARALCTAPAEPLNDDAARAAIRILASQQRADGSWPDVDQLFVCDVLVMAHPRFEAITRAPLVRAAQGLAHSQHEDGSWGRNTAPRDMLGAWRTLRAAVSEPASEPAPQP